MTNRLHGSGAGNSEMKAKTDFVKADDNVNLEMHDIEEFRETKGQCKEKPLNSPLKRKNLFLNLTRKTMRAFHSHIFHFFCPYS